MKKKKSEKIEKTNLLIDHSLNELREKVLFPEKLNKVNGIIDKIGLPIMMSTD